MNHDVKHFTLIYGYFVRVYVRASEREKHISINLSIASYASSQCRIHSSITNINLVEEGITHFMPNTDDQHTLLPFYTCNICSLGQTLIFNQSKVKIYPCGVPCKPPTFVWITNSIQQQPEITLILLNTKKV